MSALLCNRVIKAINFVTLNNYQSLSFYAQKHVETKKKKKKKKKPWTSIE
uniref:Male sterile-like protein n=1 Tax=Brassica oleracea var. gongylodes TaxID=109379 RepID=D4NY58_BRAOL|nr:male sterile-like protein [Brassica oleracea var. gongylodes]